MKTNNQHDQEQKQLICDAVERLSKQVNREMQSISFYNNCILENEELRSMTRGLINMLLEFDKTLMRIDNSIKA